MITNDNTIKSTQLRGFPGEDTGEEETEPVKRMLSPIKINWKLSPQTQCMAFVFHRLIYIPIIKLQKLRLNYKIIMKHE